MSEELYSPDPNIMLKNVKQYLYHTAHNQYVEAVALLEEYDLVRDPNVEAYDRKLAAGQKAGKAVATIIVSNVYSTLPAAQQAKLLYELVETPEPALTKHLQPLLEDLDDELVERFWHIFSWYFHSLHKKEVLDLVCSEAFCV